MKVLKANHEVWSEPVSDIDCTDTFCSYKGQRDKSTSRILRCLCGCASSQKSKQSKHLNKGTTVKMGVKSNDSVIYETFGMRICTKELSLENGIHTYSHVVQNVTENGPAAKMGIRDGDEVILIDGLHFAPYFSHPQVTELFRNIKIDGKTTFALLLHRHKRSLRFISSVLWVATSAVLAPDKLDTGMRPTVIEKEIRKSRKVVYCSESNSLYQISGEQKFLEICNNNVTASVMTGTDLDKYKIIRKMTRISRARGDIPTYTYESALSDILKKQFINIDGAKIVLQTTPVWFNMKMEGNNINFKKKGQYLAYANTEDRKSVV